MIRDKDACFVYNDEGWIKYKWNSTKKVYEKEGITRIDIRECHPAEGWIENQVVYTHFKYNMTEDHKQNNPDRMEAVTINEMEPQEAGTHIYSDGSSYMEQRQGACAAIVNRDGKNFVGNPIITQRSGEKIIPRGTRGCLPGISDSW